MNTTDLQHNLDTAKGILATTAGAASLIVSGLEQVEDWLRIGSLCVTMIVGVVTVWSILRKRGGGR